MVVIMKNTSVVLWDVAPYSVPSSEMQVNFYQTTHEHIPEDSKITWLTRDYETEYFAFGHVLKLRT